MRDCASARSVQTRETIAPPAMDLFGERGYDSVTVADVARAAGVSEKTVFNYFPAKEDLVFGRGQARRQALIHEIRTRPPGASLVEPFRRQTEELIDRLERGTDRRIVAVPRLVTRQLGPARAAVHRLGARGGGAHAGDRGGDGQRARRPRPGRRRALAGVDAPARVPRRLHAR